MTPPVFHITTRAAWAAAQHAGEYRAASLEAEGFIHLSTAAQLPGTLRRFYRGVPDLVVLTIDPTRLRGELRYERADRDDFPHLYGPLELDAVIVVQDAPPVP